MPAASGGCAEEGCQDLNFSRNAALWLVIVLFVFASFNLFEDSATPGPQQPLVFSDFIDQVEKGQVLEVTIEGQEIEGQFRDGREFKTHAPGDPSLVERLRANGVHVEAAPPEEVSPLFSFLISWFPMLLLIGVWIFVMARFGALTRQWIVLNAALWLVIAPLLFALSNLFAPPG